MTRIIEVTLKVHNGGTTFDDTTTIILKWELNGLMGFPPSQGQYRADLQHAAIEAAKAAHRSLKESAETGMR